MTGTHFNYYHVCKRKLWLFANGIQMEHTSDMVYDGKLIHEQSYPQRSERYEEMEIDGIKIDYYDPRNKVIHEIKRSDKVEKAHEWQVKYYIRVLERNGISDVVGILYPFSYVKASSNRAWMLSKPPLDMIRITSPSRASFTRKSMMASVSWK